ncbi:MAG: response regulator [Candidatus Buchananbacteria bacterium]
MAKILVVDDDPDSLVMTARAASREGFEILTAYGAQQALTLLANQPVDVVLSDNCMPFHDDGLRLAAELQTRGINIPVILLTGYSDLDHRFDSPEKLATFGLSGYVEKPFHITDLHAAIDAALAQKNLVQSDS